MKNQLKCETRAIIYKYVLEQTNTNFDLARCKIVSITDIYYIAIHAIVCVFSNVACVIWGSLSVMIFSPYGMHCYIRNAFAQIFCVW